ncbi:MAG: rod shape-determining protein MreC [Bacteroidales bacterium]|nr:rod shape-determining protein MreC [Bacteroidales bacterium]
MKNLLNFIVKYLYTITFILIEIVCFTLIFTANNYHKISFLNSSNKITAGITEQWHNITEYLSLKHVNDSIIADNQRLRNQLERYRKDNIPAIEESGFEYVSAKIISANVNSIKNFLTINKGEKHKIKKEMGVIGANGIVGIVYDCSSKYASIMPVINPNIKISVKLQKNDYFGSLSWDSKNNNIAQLDEIPNYVNISLGDEIVTSGHSSIFPEGIPVGIVSEFTEDQSSGFYKITVNLHTDYNNIRYVYVIINNNYSEHINIKNLMTERND